MHSRKLSGFDQDDLFLLYGLSRLDRLSSQKAQNLHYYQMSLPEALAFYDIMGTALIRTPEDPELGKYDPNEKSEHKNKSSSHVMEVYQIQRYTNHNAKERMQEKQNENNKSEKHEPVTPTNTRQTDFQNNALQNLDCSRGQDYLLYAYNQKGDVCIIGKDNQPGTYGGRITNGRFYSKA